MPIYDIFETEKEEELVEEGTCTPPEAEAPIEERRVKDRLFSSIAARLFFALLFIGDLLWFIYSVVLFSAVSFLSLATLKRFSYFNEASARAWISIKRSLVCAMALFTSLFSPAFGIMIACTYFLMYDKTGIEEVVPSSLQSQFKEFFKNR